VSRKFEIWSVKVFPIVANVNLLTLIVLQYFGIDVRGLTAFFLGVAFWPMLNLWIQSKDLHFCSWHRVLLVNIVLYAILSLLEVLKFKSMYYIYIATIVTSVLLLGVAVFLYRRYGCFKVATKGVKVDRYGLGLRGVRATTARGQRGSNKNINNVLL
jgi:CDP-diglyceride synthetase